MSWRILLRLALYDGLERVRGYGFLLTLGLTAYLGYAALPSASAGYSVMSYGGGRSLYNGAWVGCTVALITGMLLSLPGFYLVSNAAVLGSLAGLMALSAVAIQGLRGAASLEPLAILKPFLVLSLPALLLTAALALLFESVRWLRGTLGRVLYFFAWMGMLAPGFDLIGIWQVSAQVRARHPLSKGVWLVLA